MRQALLIVDVQNDYFAGGKSELVDPLGALENIEKVLTHFRESALLVIHVQHINRREGAAFFLPDTEGVRIHPRLAPREGECLVVKHAPNSFFETELLDLIKRHLIAEVLICGMMSHMCVDTTTWACKDHGIKATLLDDACATKHLTWNGRIIPAHTVHDVFMASLHGTFADVVKTNDYLSLASSGGM